MIHVSSWIRHLGENTPESYELTTEGTLEHTENGITLFYDESEISGMQGTHTSLSIGSSLVLLKRKGLNRMTLTFEVGKRLKSVYLTPYGEFEMEVLTQSIDQAIDENHKGTIKINYHMVIKGLSKTENRLEVTIR